MSDLHYPRRMVELLKRLARRANDFFGFVPSAADESILDALDFAPEEDS